MHIFFVSTVALLASPITFVAADNAMFADEFIGITFGEGEPMKLHLLNATKTSGAVCLDGTPAGFYFSPATAATDDTKWQLYFQGGGWCYDEEDCWGRSKTNLGSSKRWAGTSSMGGIMSDDCKINPDFCNFNRVHMVYCDGNSFSGNRDEAVTINGDPIYFRGRRIIDETLKALASDFGLSNADTVLLTGCSAGGLATYLHTDYVHQQVAKIAPDLKKFRASAISGFFLDHKTVEGKNVYPDQMKEIFQLANSTHGLNDACIANFKEEDQWQCNFAQYAYAFTETATFPLNSALDSWQTGCIYTSEYVDGFPHQTVTNNGNCSAAPGWQACSKNPESCTSTQIDTMNQYINDFNSIMNRTTTFTKNGNGAFIHSCHTHCEAQSSAWNTFTVNGKTIQEAVSEWWHDADDAPAEKHTYLPCLYKDGAQGPRKCNPTC